MIIWKNYKHIWDLRHSYQWVWNVKSSFEWALFPSTIPLLKPHPCIYWSWRVDLDIKFIKQWKLLISQLPTNCILFNLQSNGQQNPIISIIIQTHLSKAESYCFRLLFIFIVGTCLRNNQRFCQIRNWQ